MDLRQSIRRTEASELWWQRATTRATKPGKTTMAAQSSAIRCLLALLLVLLPGCLEDTPAQHAPTSEGPRPSSSGSMNGQETGSSPELPSESLPDNEIRLQDCLGILTLNEVPPGLVQAVGIDSWQGSIYPVLELRLEVHQCSRISVAGFERGPIGVVIETHNNRTTPPECQPESAQVRTEVLHRVWVSDPEISEYFATRFGMPTGILQKIDGFSSSLMMRDTIPFTINGETNRLGISVAEGSGSFTQLGELRLFWNSGKGGVGMMDFTTTTISKSGNAPATLGSIFPPLLASVVGDPQYVGYGGSFSGSDATGTIKIYGDARCEN
jgi:hypothetical protein